MKKNKRGKHPPLPPLKSSDFRKMLRADQWYEVKGGNHPNWEHPTKPGKVQLPDYWTGVKTSHDAFKGVLRQTGWTKAEAIALYWSTR